MATASTSLFGGSRPAPPAPPMLTVNNATTDEGQTIAGSSLIASVVNPAGKTTTEYSVKEMSGGDGKLYLNGKLLSAGVAHRSRQRSYPS
jgi:hypothetical protein